MNLTVFIENKQPVTVKVNKDTIVADVLKELGLKDNINYQIYRSKNKDRPVTGISSNYKVLQRENSWNTKYTDRILPQKEQQLVLWIGMPPKGIKPKYFYNWIGNEKRKKSEIEAHEEFNRRARYIHPGVYDIQGIKANDTGELFQLWIKAMDYELV